MKIACSSCNGRQYIFQTNAKTSDGFGFEDEDPLSEELEFEDDEFDFEEKEKKDISKEASNDVNEFTIRVLKFQGLQ